MRLFILYLTDIHLSFIYCRAPAPVEEPVAAEVVPETEGEYYLAVYPYNSAEPGDLIFETGETIIVTRKDGDWWTGTVAGTNRTGIFPSNYVQTLDAAATTNVSSVRVRLYFLRLNESD